MKYIIKEENLKKAIWKIFDKIFEELVYMKEERWEGFYTTKTFENEPPPSLVVGFNRESGDNHWYHWGLYFKRPQLIFGLDFEEFNKYLKYYLEEKYNVNIFIMN